MAGYDTVMHVSLKRTKRDLPVDRDNCTRGSWVIGEAMGGLVLYAERIGVYVLYAILCCFMLGYGVVWCGVVWYGMVWYVNMRVLGLGLD